MQQHQTDTSLFFGKYSGCFRNLRCPKRIDIYFNTTFLALFYIKIKYNDIHAKNRQGGRNILSI